MRARIAKLIGEGAHVLEIGPGLTPLPQTTHTVGRYGENVTTVCDVETWPLPFGDKEFDFVYCRHVVEDLHNPHLLLREMGRVADAGFIETPSPLAEITRGVDGPEGMTCAWRGYHHHRWFVWEHEGALNLMGKYPILETLSIPGEDEIRALLGTRPAFWNTYFAWDDTLPCLFWEHGFHYDISGDYDKVIGRALRESRGSTEKFMTAVPKS